jgi:hypothetical protein
MARASQLDLEIWPAPSSASGRREASSAPEEDVWPAPALFSTEKDVWPAPAVFSTSQLPSLDPASWAHGAKAILSGSNHFTNQSLQIALHTDFTGVDAPGAALEDLRRVGFCKYRRASGSDSDSYVRQFLRRNKLVEDLASDFDARRQPESLQGWLELYVAGPPCPPFSSRNKAAKGFQDIRGQLLLKTLQRVQFIQTLILARSI